MKLKKLLATVLTMAMVATAMPVTAFADDGVTDEASLKEALAAGGEVVLDSDITLTEELEIPDGVTLNGNGKAITGKTVVAGGDLTFKGKTKIESFSAGYYDRTITIGEGACLEVTGTGRVTLGYGNTFNITGSIDNAKTADKESVQPSLIVPGGFSITGGNDAAFNVTNAYVQIGSTTSKNNAANGKFDINFTNSIIEFTSQFTLSEPTSGMNPTFNVNIKDSVMTTGTKFINAVPNGNITIDNSTVTLSTYFRNSGTTKLINGSELTGSTIQFGENGGNDGTITVNNSKLAITATSTGHAFDGKGTGELIVENGAEVNVDYFTDTDVTISSDSSLTAKDVLGESKIEVEVSASATGSNSILNIVGKDASALDSIVTVKGTDGNEDVEVKFEDGKVVLAAPVAQIGDTKFKTLQAAINAAEEGTGNVTIKLLANVAENVTVTQKDGLHLTIDGDKDDNWTLTGKIIIDGQSSQIEGQSTTIKNLIFDAKNLSGTTGDDACIYIPGGDQRYSCNVTVDSCTFRDSGEVTKDIAAIKQATGGCKNWTITNCVVDDSMHSMMQAKSFDGLTIKECEIKAARGMSLNNSTDVVIDDCEIDVDKYAVRIGVDGNKEASIVEIKNSEIKSECEGEDTAILLRGSADVSEIIMTGNSVIVPEGENHIGTEGSEFDKEAEIDLNADGNYWSGGKEPKTELEKVSVTSYYEDEAMKNLVFVNENTIACIGATGYATLEDAFAAVKDGETITLVKDVELDKAISFAKDITFTLDGGESMYSIKPASDSAETNCAFNWSPDGNDSTKENRNYTIKNVAFDGWTTDHVVRLQGVTATIDNCAFVNCNQPDGLALLSLNFTDATITGCAFDGNEAVSCISVNAWADGSDDKVLIEKCYFEDNKVTIGVETFVDSEVAIEKCEFLFNEAKTAVVFLSSEAVVTGSQFEGNVLTGENTNGAAVLAGPWVAGDYAITISNNAFLNTTKGDKEIPAVVVETFDGANAAYNLNINYWNDGNKPVAGVDYAMTEGSDVTIDTYMNYFGWTEDGIVGGFEAEDPTPTPSTGGGSGSKKYSASVDKDSIDNGSVKLSSTRVKVGSTVTITVTPDEGYELDELKVLDKDGNEVELTDKGTGKYTFKMPKGGVEVDASFVPENGTDAPVVKEDSTLVLTIGQLNYQEDGTHKVNDVSPIIKGDRTMLPIRLIAEFLGATVTWNEAEQSVTIVKDDTTIVIYIGQAFALLNGEPVQLDAPAFIQNDRTYLPVSFIAENLGAEVIWDGVNQTVTVIG